MNKKKDKEILYFQSKLSSVDYNTERFEIMFGEDKFLFGVVSAGNDEAPYGN